MSGNREVKEGEMKYLGTLLAVSDINVARKFYEDMFGLEVFQDYGINISFSCGLSLQQEFDWIVGVPKEIMLKDSNNMELYFESDDFDGFIDMLKGYPGIKYVHEAKEAGWGQRSIRFYDPDGHIIEVGEPMEMVLKRFFDSGMTKEEVAERIGASLEDLEKLMGS